MFRAHIANTVPKFRQLRHLDVKTHEKSQRHEEKREGKERINLTDNLVDRQHRGKNIINKLEPRTRDSKVKILYLMDLMKMKVKKINTHK